jgi:hypothetical protein
MSPSKLILSTVLFAMLALVALPAEAQNGLRSSSDESTTTGSSSTEKGDSTLDSPTFQSNIELDQHYDKSGLNQHYDKSGLDKNYDKSGLDEQYDKSGLDEDYYKSETIK